MNRMHWLLSNVLVRDSFAVKLAVDPTGVHQRARIADSQQISTLSYIPPSSSASTSTTYVTQYIHADADARKKAYARNATWACLVLVYVDEPRRETAVFKSHFDQQYVQQSIYRQRLQNMIQVDTYLATAVNSNFRYRRSNEARASQNENLRREGQGPIAHAESDQPDQR